jgi:hypothetical protein
MIRYLINNIRVFFTFIYVFFQDYTRIIYPFVDSIEEKTNLLNLALFLEKLPENFGEDDQEKIEELNPNIETKSNEINTNENNSESKEIDNIPLIFSEIEKTIVNNLELNENKDTNDNITNSDEESKNLEENKIDVEIQEDNSKKQSNQEIYEESQNKIIETHMQEYNIQTNEEHDHEKLKVIQNNNVEKENNIIKNEDTIESTIDINNTKILDQLIINDLSEVKEDFPPKDKKGKKNKVKNKNTFQELEKVSIEKF